VPLIVWIFIRIFLAGSVKLFSATLRFGRSRSSKVIDFGTNRKRILLVRYSKFGPLDQIANVWVNLSRYLKLFGHEIIFEVFQPCTKKTYLNVTDRQTEGQTICYGMAALFVASCGRN